MIRSSYDNFYILTTPHTFFDFYTSYHSCILTQKIDMTKILKKALKLKK